MNRVQVDWLLTCVGQMNIDGKISVEREVELEQLIEHMYRVNKVWERVSHSYNNQFDYQTLEIIRNGIQTLTKSKSLVDELSKYVNKEDEVKPLGD